jgi:hypothetical protein
MTVIVVTAVGWSLGIIITPLWKRGARGDLKRRTRTEGI